MKARLVQIGNSRGVRLPKPMIEEAGLNDDVDIHVKEGSIIITSNLKPRTDWADSAKLLHGRNEDVLIDNRDSTAFDETEWQW
jgi:antitoxin MazE